jgi:hypothetical protein
MFGDQCMSQDDTAPISLHVARLLYARPTTNLLSVEREIRTRVHRRCFVQVRPLSATIAVHGVVSYGCRVAPR